MVAEHEDVGDEPDPRCHRAEIPERRQGIPVAAAAHGAHVGRNDHVLAAADVGVTEPVGRLGHLRHVLNRPVDLPAGVVVGEHREDRCRNAYPQGPALERDRRAPPCRRPLPPPCLPRAYAECRTGAEVSTAASPATPASTALGTTGSVCNPMKLRPTYQAPDARRYRAAGGPWDIPVLDGGHAPAVSGGGRRPGRRRPALQRARARGDGGRAGGRPALHGDQAGRRGVVADAELVGGPRPLPCLLALWRPGRAPAPPVRCGRGRVHGRSPRAEGDLLFADAAPDRARRCHGTAYRGPQVRRAPGRHAGAQQSQPALGPGRGHVHLGIDRTPQSGAAHAPRARLQVPRHDGCARAVGTRCRADAGADGARLGIAQRRPPPGRGRHADGADGALGRAAGLAPH